jgi:AraC family transcriptional regulator of adaptative response/methylated-DNA-[protein]-cysteine methyltransferase
MMLPDEQCWEAVERRDASLDGSFFYSVRTTGVYCRPGCASRQPRRENVAFYATADEAEKAGFRACKRCRPRAMSSKAHQTAAVEKACALIRASETTPSLAELADAAGMSRFHFHRLFKEITGTTPADFAKTHRLAQFAAQLDDGKPVTEAIYAAGYGSSSRAYSAASTGLGMTPGARRKNGRGETIRFAFAETALGTMLIAATERGICALEFGDDETRMAAAFKARFASADLAEDDGTLRDWARQVAHYVTAPGRAPDLPLDISGTAFQARVWRALQRIPVGETVSYGALARSLGLPGAARAVGAACRTNEIAVLIPCHRVVGGDGELTGYRWGIERKRALLERERTMQIEKAS